MSDKPYPDGGDTMHYELHTAWDEGYAEGFAAGRAAASPDSPDDRESLIAAEFFAAGMRAASPDERLREADRAALVESIAQTERFRGGPCLCSDCVEKRADAEATVDAVLAALAAADREAHLEPAPQNDATRASAALAAGMKAAAAASPDERLREAGERLAQAVARVCGEGHPALGMWRVALAAADREAPDGCRAPHCWSEYGTPCGTCPAVPPVSDENDRDAQ